MSDDTLARVYGFICDYFDKTGVTPSPQDVAVGTRLPTREVRPYLLALAADGHIQLAAGTITQVRRAGDAVPTHGG